MPQIALNTTDAGELGELLTFLGDWLDADRATLHPSLTHFVGHPGYGLDQLREDLSRFTFLLGHTDGEGVFTPDR